eukprot:PhM_4_TR7530/c0_g2_i1/m.28155
MGCKASKAPRHQAVKRRTATQAPLTQLPPTAAMNQGSVPQPLLVGASSPAVSKKSPPTLDTAAMGQKVNGQAAMSPLSPWGETPSTAMYEQFDNDTLKSVVSATELRRRELVDSVDFGDVQDSPMSSPEAADVRKRRFSSVLVVRAVDDFTTLLFVRDLVSKVVAHYGEVSPAPVIMSNDCNEPRVNALLSSLCFDFKEGKRGEELVHFDFSRPRPDRLLADLCEALVSIDQRCTELGAGPLPVCFDDKPHHPYMQFGALFQTTFLATRTGETCNSLADWMARFGLGRDSLIKGCTRKFGHDGKLRGMLLSTGLAPLLYCVDDNVVGAAVKADIVNEHPYDVKLRGQNGLGDALMITRTLLMSKLQLTTNRQCAAY